MGNEIVFFSSIGLLAVVLLGAWGITRLEKKLLTKSLK